MSLRYFEKTGPNGPVLVIWGLLEIINRMNPAKHLIFLFGEDTYRSFAKLTAIKDRYRSSALGDTNLATLEASQTDPTEFVREVQALPFLAKSRLVVVRDLCLAGREQFREAVLRFLSKIPPTTIVVFYEAGVPDRRTKLFRALKTETRSTEYQALTESEQRQWISQQLIDAFGSAPIEVITHLGKSGGSDLWRLTEEIKKLRLYLSGRKIESVSLQELAVLLPSTDTADVFSLIDTVMRGSLKSVLRVYDRLIDQDENELYLLSMLQFGVRSLLLVVDAYEEGQRTTSAISRSTGMNPYVVGKYLPQAPKLASANLLGVYEQLLATDVAIKTGRVAPRDALEMLLLSLAKVVPLPLSPKRTGANRQIG